MQKKKYVKPTVQSFDSVSIAHGSCRSGTGEYDLEVWNCTTGVVAGDSCGGGSTVISGGTCDPAGGNAAQSCWSGSLAG